jgi:hypothetical protein
MGLGLFFPFPTGVHGHDALKTAARSASTTLGFCCLKRPTHVAVMNLPLPQDHCVLLKLTTMTGLFLACPPVDGPFTSTRNVHVHIFTLHHDPAVHRGR